MTRMIARRPAIDSGLRPNRARPARPSPEAAGGVEVLGDAVGVDDGDEPVDEDAEVDDEDRIEDGRVDQEAEQRDLVDAEDDPGRERERQDRAGGEGQRAHRRTGIELAESGEDQREESGRERRPRARSRALWFVHRG